MPAHAPKHARKVGRPAHDRLRAMRFAMWAQHVPPHLLTPRQIAGMLDMTLQGARNWRTDFFKAISPMEIDGIPRFLTPNPEASFIAPAATGARANDKKRTSP